MRLLLDTHVAVWWFMGRPLPVTVSEAIAGAGTVMVSVASVWEIEIKRKLGKLAAPGDVRFALYASGFDVLPISIDHAISAGSLPLHHSDPFDRMLVAQAQHEGLTIVTADGHISKYDVQVLPAS